MDEPAHFEPASTRERRSPMGSLEIVVTESATGKLRASPRARIGETVTWIFEGKLAGRKLAVVRKNGPSTRFLPESGQPDEISGQPFREREGEEDFEYVIVEIIGNEDNELPWAAGRMGECIKHPGPPTD
jgi:hypothetical protein